MAAMLREAYTRLERPDYRVTKVESNPYKPPRGLLRGENGTVLVDPEWDGDPLLGLPPASREPGGLVTVEILTPGFTRETRTMGRIEQREVLPAQGEINDNFNAEEDVYYVSEARIEGPDWDHLPVTVELRFADGAIVRDAWDGKGVFREYRIVRPAPLDAVIVDPSRNIRLDIVPVNNGLAREPAGVIAGDWARWLGSVFQLMAEGISSWL
jgi:hypothetical protein